ncbi:hypothetical protein ACVDG8_029500 [Mesorhizobium sp. ORM8.1]
MGVIGCPCVEGYGHAVHDRCGRQQCLQLAVGRLACRHEELFAFRAARETAALANTIGGLECLVFTAGIGESSALVRKLICERLPWLGVALSEPANAAHAAIISTRGSKVEVRVIATDEERVIAHRSLSVMQGCERVLD